MFLILCCYNNREELERMLLPSLREQSAPYELLLIDSRREGYRSAAEAYNRTLEKRFRGGALPDGLRLIFLHQDIAFSDPHFLTTLSDYMDRRPGVVGLAGITPDRRILSNLRYRRTGKYITRLQTEKPEEAASLDECFFALPAALWAKVRFDEATCDHWHLYAVDLCYALRLTCGAPSYILPLNAYHKEDDESGLFTDNHFLSTMSRMVKKYRRHFPFILTICYQTSTRRLPALLHAWRIRHYNWKLGRRG